MRNISVDIHKHYCYGIIAEDRKIVRETKFVNTKEGWYEFLPKDNNNTRVVIEASSVTESVLRTLENIGIKPIVANPGKVRIIAEATVKTDRIDAKRLLELDMADLIPETWIPDREIRDTRHLARYRVFLVRIRTKIKNRLHMELNRENLDVKDITYRYLEDVKDKNIMINQLYHLLRETNDKIQAMEKEIDKKYEGNKNAEIIDTIPGFGKYSSLLLGVEIDNANRFSNSYKICSWAGLTPRTYQSGNISLHGRITKEGNKWVRWCLEQCVLMHTIYCPGSPISRYYQRLKIKKGHGKAIIAASRKMLAVIYKMLINKITFQDYLEYIKKNSLNPSSTQLQKKLRGKA